MIIKGGIEVCQSEIERHTLAFLAKRSGGIEGEYAEVGVFKGGTAMIISQEKPPHKRLFLFDTFEGLKDAQEIDGGLINGNIRGSDEDYIVRLFIGQDSVIIRKGYFPDSVGNSMDDSVFAFVHIDVDTYKSTLNCLEYFHNKMSSGAAIVIHDYSHPNLKGVKKAVDEFSKNKNNIVVASVEHSSQAIINYA